MRLSAIAFVLLTGVRSLAAQSDPSIGELVADLSSESYQDREEATRMLWEMGEETIQALREARMSDDPETSMRAAQILAKVELAITPNTPPDILALIEAYRTANQKQKIDVLNSLKGKKAWFQVLKLYSMEPADVRIQMASAMRGVAISGAREAISRNDFDAAVRLLELSSSQGGDLMALASIYRTTGRLDEELANLRPPGDVRAGVWKTTLLRAKGDLEGAAEAAESSKQMRLASALRVLSGDPVPWLRQNGLGDRRQQANDAYIAIALKRWSGEKVNEADFEPLLVGLQSHDESERAQAMGSLVALGRLAEAEEIQAKENPSLAFEYYLSQERLPEALEVFGLDPANPDYITWAASRFTKMNGGEDEEDENTEPASELRQLAAFLERRGEHEKLTAAFHEPLARLAVESENRFLDFLRSLFNSRTGAPQFAMAEAILWAGEDEGRWEEIFTIALGEDDSVREWRDWMKEIKPDLEPTEEFEAALALFRISDDPKDLRDQWLNLAWEKVDAADERIRKNLIRRILNLSINQQDTENALKAYDLLAPSGVWNSIDRYLSAAGRWKEAAEILGNAGNNATSSSPEIHAYLAVNYRRGGMEKEAALHDEWAEKLALGFSPSCSRIGAYYAYGGDEERAAMWFSRAAIQADPTSDEFVSALVSFSSMKLRQGDWTVAASCYEALVQIFASQEYVRGEISDFIKARLSADLAKALAILPDDRPRAVALLDAMHKVLITDGVLADEFFPLVREAGLVSELENWFAESWGRISEVIEKYPESDNTRNTAAWFASRAQLKLDEAERHLQAALARNPDQAAYLDTMAEVQFARGKRKQALEWSRRSVGNAPFDDMIRSQYYRFESGRIPD